MIVFTFVMIVHTFAFCSMTIHYEPNSNTNHDLPPPAYNPNYTVHTFYPFWYLTLNKLFNICNQIQGYVSVWKFTWLSAHLRDYIKLWYPICTENQLEFITFAICCNFCICTFIKWLFIIGKSILMHTNNKPSIKHRIKVYAWDYNFSRLYHNR